MVLISSSASPPSLPLCRYSEFPAYCSFSPALGNGCVRATFDWVDPIENAPAVTGIFKLHDNTPSGNAYKVRLLLTQLDIPFERIAYDTDKGETRTAAFLALNPNGRVPVLEIGGGRCLAESNAILCYLADDTHFLPADRFQRAQVMQ